MLDEKAKAAINKACEERDHDRFYELAGECTPDELATFMYGPESHEMFVFMLWCASETWGFEVEWAYEDRMTPEELQAFYEKEGCGPDSDAFTRGLAGEPRTPHKKLKEHRIWAPSELAFLRKVQESN